METIGKMGPVKHIVMVRCHPSLFPSSIVADPTEVFTQLDAEHNMYTKQYYDGKLTSIASTRKFGIRSSDNLVTFPAAYPAAKVYIPARATETWRKKGWIPSDGSKFFSFGAGSKPGEAVEDPFEESTGGEIKSADFGKAFINEVRRKASCPTLLFGLALTISLRLPLAIRF